MTYRLLFVDDEPRLLEGIRRALHKERFEILTATSGVEALRILESNVIDVIVSDQDMPGMKGTALLARVAREHPHTIRFILTGKATLGVAIEAVNEGAVSRFLTKPFDPVDLAVTIRQALQHRALMAVAWRLLDLQRRQSEILARLERENPGITRVHRDEEGVIRIQASEDCDALIQEIARQVDNEERRRGRPGRGALPSP